MFLRNRTERGAAAVEMAIVLPLLLLLLAGVIDLGRLMFSAAEVTNAAREGARMIALGYSAADATTRAQQASPYVQGAPLVLSVGAACTSPITPASNGTVTVRTTTFKWLVLGNAAKFFGATIVAPQPSSTASMRCLG